MKFIAGNKVFAHKEFHNTTYSPITAEIQITNRCNNMCYYCGQKKLRDASELSDQQLSDTFTILNESTVKGVYFSGGGEPTIYKEFEFLKRCIENNNFDYGLITNGVNLNEKWRELLIDKFKWVRFSIDSADSQTYESIRGTKHFDKVMDNIEALFLLKKQTENNLVVGFQVVVNDKNIDQIDVISESLLKKFPDVNYISIRPIECDIKKNPYQKEKLLLLKKIFDKLKKKSKIQISDKWQQYFNNEKDFGFSACYASQYLMTITAWGEIYPCCHVTNMKNYCLGSINDWFRDIQGNYDRLFSVPEKGFNPDVCPFPCRGSSINNGVEEIKNINHKNFL